ncbi:MAG: [Abditibacteriota bacterium]|nr:[FeFe] hydrogenase H-cluster maturation GTPase HydF [Abditibacteriota bacterium]
MNETAIAERVRISFFGRRNVGKSSLINAIANQNLSIVSPVPGTTTDPVNKTMELLPLGPVVLTDTAGLDDEGELGQIRVLKTNEVFNKTDIGIIVFDLSQKDLSLEEQLIDKFKAAGKPYILVGNKQDLGSISENFSHKEKVYFVSASQKKGIEELKEAIGKIKITDDNPSLLSGIAEKGKVIVLVCPIDDSAPKGRLILPQVMAVRDILDNNGICLVVQPGELKKTLEKITPYIVITDSQAFREVAQTVPNEIKLTSFSILMARHKGDLAPLVEGANVIDNLEDGDKILIAEACTHHAQKNDIGKVQIPKKLSEKTGKNLVFEYVAGISFPENLSDYKLIIHCGGCMISRTMMIYRQNLAGEAKVPMTNYGVLLAKLSGILDRAINL